MAADRSRQARAPEDRLRTSRRTHVATSRETRSPTSDVLVAGPTERLIAIARASGSCCGRFDADAGARLAFLWPSPGTWYRTILEPAEIPALGGRNVLVRARAVAAPHGLSVRELEVLTCLALGLSNDAIARIFTVSARTIHGHVEHVLRKTGARSRGEAAALAWREGLIRPRPSICDPRDLQARDID